MHHRLLPSITGCAAFLLAALLAAPTTASVCSGIAVVTSDVDVVITPDPGCLEVTVEPLGCGDRSAIFVRSTCATSPLVSDGFFCEGGEAQAETCASIYTFAGSGTYEDGDVQASFDVFFEGATAEIPDAKVLIEVNYHETFESPDDEDAGGCSVGVGATPAGGAIAFLAWLLAIARRRPRAR